MRRHRLSAEADEDLVAVFIQGCDLFGVGQAGRYVDALAAVFPRLAAHPEMARLRSEFNPPFRAYNFKAQAILYQDSDDEILILRVRHGHEDWRTDPLGDRPEEEQTS